MDKKVCILSIDGGGIRGIIPGTILVYIEEQLQKRTKNPDARLADFFDLFAGTSTGGILTCAYLCPDGNGKAKYSAQKAVNLYFDNGPKIFEQPLWKKIESVGGLKDEKFPQKELENALKTYFGDIKLSQLLKPSIITSYDIQNRRAVFFNKEDAKNDYSNYYVRDVCRATSAAPTYFEVADVHSLFGTPLPLIDGGVFANNPAMCAYAEARQTDFTSVGKKLKPIGKDMILVSIGTGTDKKPYSYKDAKDWGIIGWAPKLIDIMMSGNSETIDFQLKLLFEAAENSEGYFRLMPGLFNASSEMDNASQKNMNDLKEAGGFFIEENLKQLDTIVDELIANQA